jgi:hypothetical protein
LSKPPVRSSPGLLPLRGAWRDSDMSGAALAQSRCKSIAFFPDPIALRRPGLRGGGCDALRFRASEKVGHRCADQIAVECPVTDDCPDRFTY